jgi:outer membrane protein TolC
MPISTAFSQSAEEDSRGLTADAVAERVLRSSPELETRRQRVAAAQAAVDQARAAFIPKIAVSALLGVASRVQSGDLGTLVVAPQSPPGPLAPGALLVNQPIAFPLPPAHRYSVQASLTVPLSDYLLRTRPALVSSEHSEAAVALDRKASEISVGIGARVLYYHWVRAKLQVDVAEQAVRQSKDHLRDAKNAFEAGRASRADVLSSESQLARSELLRDRALHLVSFNEEQLRIAMRDSDYEPYRVREKILADPPPARDEALASLQNQALEARLEPRSLERGSASLKEQAKVADSGMLPRLDAVASILYANPNQNLLPLKDAFNTTWLLGLQASWEINGIVDARAARRGFEARAAEVEARREAVRDAIRSEVASAVQSIQDARAAIQSTAQSLTASEEAYRVRRELYQNGRASSLELSDAETDLTSARFTAIDAQIDTRIARLSLAQAMGKSTPP